MNAFFKFFLIVVPLATVGLVANAQTPGALAPGAPMMQHERMDPAKMQERMAKHQEELKVKLNLSAAQANAWTTVVAAMQLPADMAAPMNPENRKKMREEMASLTTPERIDRMSARAAQRSAELAKRAAAVKNFYWVLNHDQQKIFDAETLRHFPGIGKPGHPG